MKELTKAEEEVMQVLWDLKTAFVKDVLEKFPEPKPAYNTISTIIRILEKKGFIDHKSFGNTHEYFPTIEKNEYREAITKNLINDYFDNSFTQLVSAFTKDKKLSVKELEIINQLISEELKKKENQNE
jgi:predicted transcriptional regulator